LKAVYDVNWVKGQAIGYGKFMTMDRDIYEGSFLNGKRHGEGTFTWADGSRIAGYWENGIRDDSRVRDLPPKVSDWSPPESFLNAKPSPFSDYAPIPPPGWDNPRYVSQPTSYVAPNVHGAGRKEDAMQDWQKRVLEKKRTNNNNKGLM